MRENSRKEYGRASKNATDGVTRAQHGFETIFRYYYLGSYFPLPPPFLCFFSKNFSPTLTASQALSFLILQPYFSSNVVRCGGGGGCGLPRGGEDCRN